MSTPTPNEINQAMQLDPLHPDSVVRVGPKIWSDGLNSAYAVRTRNLAYRKRLQTDKKYVAPVGTEQVYFQTKLGNKDSNTYMPRMSGGQMHIRSNL